MKLITFIFFLALFSSISAFTQINDLKKAHDKIERKLLSKGNVEVSKSIYVNPFIGTGGHGHTYPGATAPFGMIQLSPDTRHTGWDGCSGYHFSDSIIYGFSHTHLSGTGVSDYGDLLIVPQNGKPKIDPGYLSKKGYGDQFNHDREEATPGFYAVHLDNQDIDVRLSVTERSGMHEYTFNNKKGKKFILIDLDHRDKVIDATINIINQSTISGSRISEAWATEQHFYFHLETDIPYHRARKIMKNGKHKLLLTFPKDTEKIKIRVGISAVNELGAKENLLSEINHWNFNKVRAQSTKLWNDQLGKIEFQSSDEETMKVFYSSLYHTYIAPNIFYDRDGKYRGRDNKVHQLNEGEEQYTVFSLWDTYRATHPLFTLTQVDKTTQFINTFLRQYEEGGDLPVWELAGNETECMIGYHSVSVIADAYLKGIGGFNQLEAIEAMIATSNFDEYGKHEFNSNGFIGTSKEPESVSKTLEYAYDSYCIKQMLEKYGTTTNDSRFDSLKQEYEKRSLSFVNIFDPDSKFMRGRRSGQWFSPFDPAEVNFNYTEANSWQYSLYTPHGIELLSNLMGGMDSLESWLDRLFNTQMELSGRHQADITGLIGQYAHGNEPSHHMAYLYNYTNSPEKTQLYLDSILNEMYSNAPDGLSGNEDCGQMSAWYVLSALGFYQINPGNPMYDIGRPIMDEATINFESGKKLRILTKNNSKKNKYIKSVQLNGKELDRHYLTHQELIDGGILEFEMDDEPVVERDQLKGIQTIDELPNWFCPTPFFTQDERIFVDSSIVGMAAVGSNVKIIYTLDGSNPQTSQTAVEYEQPITLKETTLIKAYALSGDGMSSTISNEFVKKDPTVSIRLKAKYDNQYSANGDFTLIDKIRGGNEFRTGDWQGYWDQIFEAEITFTQPRSIEEIGLGCLSDMKSWVFYPKKIIFETSVDGINFEEVGEVEIAEEAEVDMYPHHKNFEIKVLKQKNFKSIRVKAIPTDECPEWHLGEGNPTWLFVDEIFFH